MTSDQDVTKLTAERVVTRFDRRTFVRRGVALGAGLAGAGALVRFGTAAQAGSSTPATAEASPSSSSTVQTATPKIVAATNAFLKTLSASERSAVSFDWTDTAQKQRWSNLPQGAFQRSGLMWVDLNATTQNAWLKVMQATLSSEGYDRVIAEWNADEALAQQSGGGGGGGGGLTFGKKYYWIAIIGEPSETDPWQWQCGGHHVTVNATIAGSNLP